MLVLIFFSIFILYSSDLTITKAKFGKHLSSLIFDPNAKIKDPALTLAHSLVKSSATFATSSKSAAWGQLEERDFDSTASPFTKFYLKARWILANKKLGIDELSRGKELLDEACKLNIADALHFKAMAIKNDIIYSSEADDFDTALSCLKAAFENSSSADQKSEITAEIEELQAYLEEQELKKLAKKESLKAQSPKAQSPKQSISKALTKTPQDRIKELRKISNLTGEYLLELSGLLVCEEKNKEAFDFLIKSDSSNPRVISKTFDLIEYGSEKQRLLCIAKVTSLIKDSSIDDRLKDSIKERLLEISKDEASPNIIGAVLKSVLETNGLINAHLVLHQLLTKAKNEDQLLAILQRNQIITGKEFNCELADYIENRSDLDGFKATLDFYLSKKDVQRVDQAVIMLKKSADEGSVSSCMTYGKICEDKKDLPTALAYYEKATSGIPELSFACFGLLIDRKSSLHDMRKASFHLRKCLDKGDILDAKRAAVDLYFNHNNPDIQAVVSLDEALELAQELTTNKDDVIAGRAFFSLGYHWLQEINKKYAQDQDYKSFERRMVSYFQKGAKKNNEDCLMSLAGHHQNIKDFGVSQKILEENILKFKGKRVILAAETVWFENLISLNRCDEAQAYLEISLERKNPILILELLSRKINSLSIKEIIEKAKEAHQLNNGYSIPRFNIYNDRFTKKLADKILEKAVPEIVAKKEISSDTFNFMINAIEFGCKAELIEKLIGILSQINDPRWQELTLKLAARDSEEKGGL